MSRRVLLIGLVSLAVCIPGTVSVAALRHDSEDDQIAEIVQTSGPGDSLSVLHLHLRPSDAGSPWLPAWEPGSFSIKTAPCSPILAHIVERASAIMATLFDGRQVRVEVIGSDPETDVAVLRLPREKGPYATVPLGDSDQLGQAGQRALVVGSPFGLGFTLRRES